MGVWHISLPFYNVRNVILYYVKSHLTKISCNIMEERKSNLYSHGYIWLLLLRIRNGESAFLPASKYILLEMGKCTLCFRYSMRTDILGNLISNDSWQLQLNGLMNEVRHHMPVFAILIPCYHHPLHQEKFHEWMNLSRPGCLIKYQHIKSEYSLILDIELYRRLEILNLMRNIILS